MLVGMVSTIIPPGVRVTEHVLDVPWDREKAELGTFELFARELSSPEGDERSGKGGKKPPLLFLQGGPGNPAPRVMQGWIPEALKHYTVYLLDERGTGRSGKIDRTTPELIRTDIISKLRCPDVVADAEALREHLGFEQWDVLGNSFGALCTASYLSYYPEAIGQAYLTGAVPQIGWTPVEYNTTSLDLLEKRVQEFYAAVPYAERTVREICHHLDNAEEILPTGERLSSQRFRFIGVALGEELGFHHLAVLLESPFIRRGGEKHLRGDFLALISQYVGLQSNPLWAVLHETLFGAPGRSTNWAAHQAVEGRAGFALDADPTDESEPFYLLGNHFFRHHFEEDPALRPFRDVVHEMHEKTDWSRVFNEEQLRANTVPAVVALYERDMFIHYDRAVNVAKQIGGMKVWSHPTWDHDAIYLHGQELFQGIFDTAHSVR